MGEVWAAHHCQTLQPVALKLLKTAEPDMVRRLYDEIRAVARLDHPKVVWIYDFGVVEEPVGSFPPNTPWFAMERASGGTLAALPGALTWTVLREVLLELLAGLGHAHARGVLHRDLKPANILVCTGADARPGLKIADFGVARALEDPDETLVTGTPAFMAPEQILGDWRRQGPWTDLYALGGLAWWLATGDTVFSSHPRLRLFVAHLRLEPPDFAPLAPVPVGFEAWIRTLLQKHPVDRFRCAADAAHALRELGGPDLQGSGATRAPHDCPTVRVTLLDGILAPPRGRRATLTPVPIRWEDGRHPTPAPLLGAGLSLIGVREPPMVGRIAQRDTLWTLLSEVVDRAEARVAVLTGPTGSGRTRLAKWLMRRAAETGTAETVWLNGVEDGPRAMVEAWRRVLHASKLDGEALRERLHEALSDAGCEESRVTRAVYSLLAEDGMDLRTRQGVATRLLALRATLRPQILVVDGAIGAPDALLWIRAILRGARLPVLVVLTVQDERAGENPSGRTQLETLQAEFGIASVRLPPLDSSEQAALIRGLAGLSKRAESLVLDHCGGNPEYIVQRFSDWVERGILVNGPDGIEVRGDLAVGGEVGEVWASRLARVFVDLPPTAAEDLERAAVWGYDVPWTGWAGACGPDSDAGHRSRLVERLVAGGLAEYTDTGFRFRHGHIRRALIERGHQAGRLRAHHAACAAALDSNAPTQLAQRATHLLKAGDQERAFDLLIQGGLHARKIFDNQRALVLMELGTRALAEAEPSDPRWQTLYEQRARARLMVGDLAGAKSDAREALRRAEAASDALGTAKALFPLAIARRALGEEGWVDALRRAVPLAAGDPRTLSYLHYALAIEEMEQGQLEAMGHHEALAVSFFEPAGRPLDDAFRLQGYCATARGETERAIACFESAQALFEQQAALPGAALAQYAIAEIHLVSGAIDAAVSLLEEATATLRLACADTLAEVSCVLAAALALSGNAEAGLDRVEAVAHGRTGPPDWRRWFAIAACTTVLGRISERDHALSRLENGRCETGWVRKFRVSVFERCEAICEAEGDGRAAGRFRALRRIP